MRERRTQQTVCKILQFLILMSPPFPPCAAARSTAKGDLRPDHTELGNGCLYVCTSERMHFARTYHSIYILCMIKIHNATNGHLFLAYVQTDSYTEKDYSVLETGAVVMKLMTE